MPSKSKKEPAPHTPPPSNGQTPATGKVTQIEAMRRLLAAEPDLLPKAGVVKLLSEYGLTLSTGAFSNYKSIIRKEQEEPAVVTPAPTPESPAPAPGGRKVSEVVREVKALLKSYSPQELTDLIKELSNE